MVYGLLYAYFQYSSYNKSSVKWETNVTLPAITICNINPFNYSRFKEAENDTGYVDDFETIMETLIFYNGDEYAWELIDNSTWFDFMNFEQDEGGLVLRFRDWLIDTVFGYYDYVFQGVGYYINYDDYYKFSQMTELGLCFELNDDGVLKQSAGGVKGGITIDLDAKLADYLFSSTSKGFMLFIRDQDETVMLNHGSHVISPGTEVFVKLTAQSVTRLGEPHGTCQNKESRFSKYGPHYETVRECVQRQKLDMLMEECWCIPWYLAERMSTLNKTDILDEYVEKILRFSSQADSETKEDNTGESQDRRKRSTKNQPCIIEKIRDEHFQLEKIHHQEKMRQESMHRQKKTGVNKMDRYKKIHRLKREAEEVPASESDAPPTVSSSTTVVPFHRSDEYAEHICGFVEQYSCQMWLDILIREGNVSFESCSEPCFYNEWEVETSSTAFPPTREYFERFIKEQVYLHTGLPTFEYIQENMARLHIYYDELKVDHVEQTKAYDAQNFVAEFGGVVDLFIGFSFFTVFQLIEIALAWFISKVSKKKYNETKPSHIITNENANANK